MINENRLNQFKQGISVSVPTIMGYVSIGIAFGIVGKTSNLTILEILLLAAVLYAGSAQFIFCSLVVANAPFLVIVMTIFIVNFRHFLMSLTIAPYLTNYSMLRNVGFGSLLTDETFGVAIVEINKKGRLLGAWMDGLNITAYISWNIACLLGGLIGNYIKMPEKLGIDYALISMFIALLVLAINNLPRSKIEHNLKLIALMLACMYSLLFIMPSYLAVLVSTVIVTTIGVTTE